MPVLYTNNASTTLSASITAAATSLTVASGKGALFPAITGSDYFYITLVNTAGAIEIMKVTARSTDTFTVVRGQDGTTGVAWAAGDRVELRITKAMLDDVKAALISAYPASDWNVSSATVPQLINTSTNGVNGVTNYMGMHFPHTSLNYGFQIAGRNDASFFRTLENGSYTAWRTFLHSGNYSSYALPLSGGTLTGNLTLSSGYIDLGSHLYGRADIYSLNAAGTAWTRIIARNGGSPYLENITYGGNAILHAGNYNSYSPTLTGTGASGTWGINVTGSATSVGGYTSDGWLRKSGDATQFQIYGNTRTVIFRTDGTTNPHGGGAYAYIWYYGSSGDADRRMILNTDGTIWSSNYGWLHTAFAGASHTHTSIVSPNGASVVAADSAFPSAGQTFQHSLAYGPGGNDGHILAMSWSNTASVYGAQIWLDTDPTNRMAIRSRNSGGVWNSWSEVLTDLNYTNYAASAGHTHNYVPINPDGDGNAWSYSDENPTVNGVTVGGGQRFGADGSSYEGFLQAKILNAYNGFVNSGNGYYLGNYDFGANSSTYTTTLAIDASNNHYGLSMRSGRFLTTYSATPYNWNGTILQYYWTKIANINNVGDAHMRVEISAKTDVNYMGYTLAVASISAFNNSTQSIKLDVLSSYDLPVKLAVDNSGNVWIYAEASWSSYINWKFLDIYGSPTIYTSSWTQQLTQPANSAILNPGQAVRGSQGAIASASVYTSSAHQISALNTLGAITQNGNQVLHAGNYSSYALPLSGGTMTGSIGQSTYNVPLLRPAASGTMSYNAAFAIQQATTEGWTGIFVDFEPYTGWGLYHDNGNNYFSITAEVSTNSIRSFSVPSVSSGSRVAYEKIRFDQNDGRITQYAWTTSGRNYCGEWIEFPNNTGLYSPNNAAHFYPNTGWYGSWQSRGTRNGWGGINFSNNNNGDVTLMINPSSNETGFYNPSYGWQIYWTGGTLYNYKNSYGGGTQAVVLDSSNYTNYVAGLGGGNYTGTVTISRTTAGDTWNSQLTTTTTLTDKITSRFTKTNSPPSGIQTNYIGGLAWNGKNYLGNSYEFATIVGSVLSASSLASGAYALGQIELNAYYFSSSLALSAGLKIGNSAFTFSGSSGQFLSIQSGGIVPTTNGVVSLGNSTQGFGSAYFQSVRLNNGWYENSKLMQFSGSLQANYNAMMAGPVTLDTGYVITIETGATLTIV